MVIKEKALIRRMKEAYKDYGYTVAVRDGKIYLTNGYWLAEIDADNVPAEIMGMFGEHIRDIPKDGDAYRITKAKDGPIVQKRLIEEALVAAHTMYAKFEEALEDSVPDEMQKTNLTYDGHTVWQSKTNKDVFLIDPRYAAMISGAKEVLKVGDGIFAHGEVSKVWILRINNKQDKTYLAHLEKISWVTE